MAANGDLLEVLRGVSLFKGAARGELARLAASARRVDYLPRQKILREGDSGESCFVMLSGTVSVFVTDPVGGETEVARLGPGRVFGEQALIPGRANRRNASVRALTEVGVAEIPAAAFHGLLAAMPALNEVLDERANSQAQERLWRQSVLLSNMGEALQLPEQRSYVDGETVITQGETGSDVFLVLAGMARVERANGGQKQVLGRLSAGSFFGERALIRTEPRAASVIAESELQLLVIDGGRFLQAYQSNPGLRDLVEQLSAFYALSDQATVSLHKGRIDGKDTITALYVLADGRRFAASRIPDEAIFNLARLNVESRSVAQQETFSGDGGFRRSLHLVGGRLVGLAVAGPWRDLGFAFSAVIQERRLWPWQRALFRLRGELRLHRREVGSGMAAIVCQCTGRSRGQLLELLESECRDLECLVDRSGASLICGGCTPCSKSWPDQRIASSAVFMPWNRSPPRFGEWDSCPSTAPPTPSSRGSIFAWRPMSMGNGWSVVTPSRLAATLATRSWSSASRAGGFPPGFMIRPALVMPFAYPCPGVASNCPQGNALGSAWWRESA